MLNKQLEQSLELGEENELRPEKTVLGEYLMGL